MCIFTVNTCATSIDYLSLKRFTNFIHVHTCIPEYAYENCETWFNNGVFLSLLRMLSSKTTLNWQSIVRNFMCHTD